MRGVPSAEQPPDHEDGRDRKQEDHRGDEPPVRRPPRLDRCDTPRDHDIDLVGRDDHRVDGRHRVEAAAVKPAPDEEETLDEADQVPTVKVAPEEPARGPKPPKKVLALLVLLILAIAASIVIYLLVR